MAAPVHATGGPRQPARNRLSAEMQGAPFLQTSVMEYTGCIARLGGRHRTRCQTSIDDQHALSPTAKMSDTETGAREDSSLNVQVTRACHRGIGNFHVAIADDAQIVLRLWNQLRTCLPSCVVAISSVI